MKVMVCVAPQLMESVSVLQVTRAKMETLYAVKSLKINYNYLQWLVVSEKVDKDELPIFNLNAQIYIQKDVFPALHSY